MVPGNTHDAESGLLDTEDQHKPWTVGRDKKNKKAMDYLRRAYIKSLEDSPIHYKLQIQIHNMLGDPNDDEILWSPQNVKF